MEQNCCRVCELVYVLPDSNGGVATVVSNLIQFSAYPDIKKKVLLIGGPENSQDCSVDFHDAEVIREKGPLYWESKNSFCKRIARHLSSKSIIISNDGNPEFHMIESLQLHQPVIVILHGNNSHYFNGLQRYGYLVDKVICVSSFLEKRAQEILSQNTDPQFVPFPIPEIQQYTSNKTLYPLVITYSGGITEAKGCEHFPRLVQLLDELGVDYVFNIIGDGDLLPIIKERLQGTSKVKFHGQQPNAYVLDVLKSTHIVILLSKSEGLPVCLVEAMKSGAVPVVFDLPTGVPDIIDDKVNGFRMPQNDLYGVVEAIKSLDSDRESLINMAIDARKKAAEMFDPWIEAQKYEDIFLTTSARKEKFRDFTPSFFHRTLSGLPMRLSRLITSFH